MSEKKRMSININGKYYVLAHDEPEEYVHRVAKYVSGKIAATSKDGLKLVEPTASVMTCISVTDELFKTQKALTAAKHELQLALDECEMLKREKAELEDRIRKMQNRGK